MRFADEITIDARAEQVWAVYSDVTHWSEWTASITSVELLDGATDLVVGTRARIRQPKLPVAEWTVTEIEPGHTWTWVATAPGIRSTAAHTVVPTGDGTCRVDSSLTQEGPLGWVIARVYAGLTRRYLAMEAAGLKARCESSS
jgi:uncharacterized membrane protein